MDHLLEAIETRVSRRSYIDTPLKPADVEALQALVDKYNGEEDLNMRLVVGNGDAFLNFRKTYGFFSGVQNYLALVGDAKDFIETEKNGYFGELIVLEATARGLGTCWVGGTFDRHATPIELVGTQSVPCVITIGYVEPELSAREKTIKRITHRGTPKTVDEMTRLDEPIPGWFYGGMKAVQKAPSAINRQPVIFTLKDGTVTAAVENSDAERIAYDLGIAKLHFSIGAGGGSWEFGNGGMFSRTIHDT
ncbi:MAG: nitroreductase [Coriobacteriia bacterium]|nr:nitroreductase [Coriobacteriia bacterium]